MIRTWVKVHMICGRTRGWRSIGHGRKSTRKEKIRRQFKYDTMLDMYKPWEKEERIHTKTPKKGLVKNNSKRVWLLIDLLESLFNI